jgi:hypothetical protein
MREQEFMISPTVMVVAEYEMDYETIDERAKDMGLGVETIRVSRGYREYSTMDEHTTPIQNMVEIATPEHLPEHLASYFKAHNLNYVITELKGFSQGEWHDLVIYALDNAWTTEQLEGVAEEFDALFAGEVYRIEVLHAKTYTASDGDTVTQWLHDESFGYTHVTEKLFTLNADFISSHFGLEVVPEVQG